MLHFFDFFHALIATFATFYQVKVKKKKIYACFLIFSVVHFCPETNYFFIMKKIIIFFAVVMAIFATACSDAATVDIKMTENHAIIYSKDQTSAKSTDFLSVNSDDGTTITVKSDSGEVRLHVEEVYNLNEYAGHQIKFKDQALDLTPLTGFIVYKDEVRPVQALSIDTSRRTLSIASIPNKNCEVISAKNVTRTGTKGEKLPFVFVAYKEGDELKMIYIPVLRPEQRVSSDTDNVFELYFRGKLKCFHAI